MKTSQNKTRLIEKYLLGKLSKTDNCLFEAQLLIDPGLYKDLQAQKKVLLLVRWYHRKKQKEKLEKVHRQLFSDPSKRSFQQRIYQLFNSEKA